MKLLLLYLRTKLRLLSMLSVFALLFLSVLTLYHLPAEAVGYAVLLCLAVGALFAGVDFYRFVRRYRAVREAAALRLTGCALPSTDDPIEAAYQELVDAVAADRTALFNQAARDRAAARDYYTLWAHQIKTPIAAMRLILQDDAPDRAELQAQLFRVEQYVEMVLAFSRMGADSTDFLFRSCPLDSIVRQAVRKYAPLFIRKQLALDLHPLPGEVMTDEKWLCFAVEQVLSNAIKYTNKGAITISCETPGVLVIRDTGIGIAPEDLPRVFEPGFTGWNGRLDKRATGVGLYLTRQILTALGHTIAIDSTPGQGTAVTLDLRADAVRPI